MDKQSNTLCASCKSFEGCWKTKVSTARVPATILGRDAPALMAFIFHSLPLALFVELVPFIHQMQPLQGVFRQVLVKVRDVLPCTILSGLFLNTQKMALCCSSPWLFHFFLSCLVWLGISVKFCCSPAWPTVRAVTSLWSKRSSGRVQGGQSKQMDLSQSLKALTGLWAGYSGPP